MSDDLKELKVKELELKILELKKEMLEKDGALKAYHIVSEIFDEFVKNGFTTQGMKVPNLDKKDE